MLHCPPESPLRTAADAISVLDAMSAQSWHHFWGDSIPYAADQLVGVIGHRQVTDAHLVALATHNDARVATLDKGLAALHQPAVHLIRT